MKEYLKGKFSGVEVSDIMKTKLHMLTFKANYRDKNAIEHECRLCGREEETTEHIFLKCPILEEMREGMNISEDTIESDTEGECMKIIKIKRICDSLPLNLPPKRKETE